MPGVGQIGIYTPLDPSVFLRHDGTVPLSDVWNIANGGGITNCVYLACSAGGLIVLGEYANQLRLVKSGDEVMRILGVSNSEAELLQKNATMTDLAGVGVRAVMADVNGKLSAP